MELNRNNILKLTALAFIIAIIWNVITLVFFTTYRIVGTSMETTLHSGDKVIVNKVIYLIDKPHRGEVIIFHATKDTDFIKRVIGVGGDKIEFHDDALFINGNPVKEPYLKENIERAKALGICFTQDFGPVTIPENCVFVMGDNRDRSVDSREIGAINIHDIVGRSELVYYPHKSIRLIK